MKTLLNVSPRGVITLPAKLRRALGMTADSQVLAETTPEGLLLRPTVTLPVEVYDDWRVAEFDAGEAELDTYLRRTMPAKAPR